MHLSAGSVELLIKDVKNFFPDVTQKLPDIQL